MIHTGDVGIWIKYFVTIPMFPHMATIKSCKHGNHSCLSPFTILNVITGFIVTISSYQIETRYPTFSLNIFQIQLLKVTQLKCQTEQCMMINA